MCGAQEEAKKRHQKKKIVIKHRKEATVDRHMKTKLKQNSIPGERVRDSFEPTLLTMVALAAISLWRAPPPRPSETSKVSPFPGWYCCPNGSSNMDDLLLWGWSSTGGWSSLMEGGGSSKSHATLSWSSWPKNWNSCRLPDGGCCTPGSWWSWTTGKMEKEARLLSSALACKRSEPQAAAPPHTLHVGSDMYGSKRQLGDFDLVNWTDDQWGRGGGRRGC